MGNVPGQAFGDETERPSGQRHDERRSGIVTRRSMRAARSRLWVATSAARPLRATSAASVAEDMVGGLRIEIAGRLVGQQHARARWRPRGRWRRAAARRRTIRPGDGCARSAEPEDSRAARARALARLGAREPARSAAAARRFRAPRIPAADDGTGRRSRSRVRRSARPLVVEHGRRSRCRRS